MEMKKIMALVLMGIISLTAVAMSRADEPANAAPAAPATDTQATAPAADANAATPGSK